MEQRLHWAISAALVIVLAAYVKLAQVPAHFNCTLLILGYWVDIASSAVFTATILYVVQRPFASNVEGDDNIAFPSMHIALAVMAWWFCRQWKRIARVLFVYNMALILAILLLGWHYFVDLPGHCHCTADHFNHAYQFYSQLSAPARVCVETCTQTPVSPL